MSQLQVRFINSKQCRITGIWPVLVVCLQELPAILELRAKPQAHARLFPAPTANDDAINSDWAETVDPELQHLFVSAGETVGRDLTQLKPSPRRRDRYFLTFPVAHMAAWVSALNQARLILAAVAALDEIDMNVSYPTLDERKRPAVVRVDQFGALLDAFVRRALARRKKGQAS